MGKEKTAMTTTRIKPRSHVAAVALTAIACATPSMVKAGDVKRMSGHACQPWGSATEAQVQRDATTIRNVTGDNVYVACPILRDYTDGRMNTSRSTSTTIPPTSVPSSARRIQLMFAAASRTSDRPQRQAVSTGMATTS